MIKSMRNQKSGDNYTKAVRTVISTEVCGHMFERGFTLDQVRGIIESEIGIYKGEY